MAATNPEAEVVIRRARTEDYEELLAFGDVYFGKDYVMDMYHSLMEDSSIYPLVAEINGKVIGFYYNHVIDGGLTVMKRAGRVHKSYRGLKIFHRLGDALDKQRQEELSDSQYEAIGVSGLNATRAGKEFQEKGYQEIVRKSIRNMVFKLDELKDPGPPEEFSRVTRMTYEDLRLLLSNEDVTTKLFPGQRIFNWFIGYRIMESNIPFIHNKRADVYATTFSSSLLSSSLLSSKPEKSQNFTPEMIDSIDVLSFSHRYEGTAGLIYVMDVYTVVGYDEMSLKSHLRKHLYELSRLTKGDGGIFLVSFNSETEENVVMSFLKDHGIVDLVPGTETAEMSEVWYERKLAV